MSNSNPPWGQNHKEIKEKEGTAEEGRIHIIHVTNGGSKYGKGEGGGGSMNCQATLFPIKYYNKGELVSIKNVDRITEMKRKEESANINFILLTADNNTVSHNAESIFASLSNQYQPDITNRIINTVLPPPLLRENIIKYLGINRYTVDTGIWKDDIPLSTTKEPKWVPLFSLKTYYLPVIKRTSTARKHSACNLFVPYKKDSLLSPRRYKWYHKSYNYEINLLQSILRDKFE